MDGWNFSLLIIPRPHQLKLPGSAGVADGCYDGRGAVHGGALKTLYNDAAKTAALSHRGLGLYWTFRQGEEEMPLQAEQTQRRPGAKRLTLNKDFSSNLSFYPAPPPNYFGRAVPVCSPDSLLPLQRSSVSLKALGAAGGQRAAPNAFGARG